VVINLEIKSASKGLTHHQSSPLSSW